MKAVVAAFNQEKALVGAFSVIVQLVVEPMDRFAALAQTVQLDTKHRHNESLIASQNLSRPLLLMVEFIEGRSWSRYLLLAATIT